ncbi:MAG: hypothetical protein JNM39_14290 [Bdellovibrionaceae bacterium]|nr:hypothetical protein [Pseudobdellovibrionaceae bacterium]
MIKLLLSHLVDFFLRFNLFLLVLLANLEAGTRPESAAENLYVSCNICHVNPMGGGLRNAVIEFTRAGALYFLSSRWILCKMSPK